MSSDAALRVAPRDRLLGELLLDAGLVGSGQRGEHVLGHHVGQEVASDEGGLGV